MPEISKDEYSKMMEQFKSRLAKDLPAAQVAAPQRISSREYLQFRKELMPKHITLYEKACKMCEFLGLQPSKKDLENVKESIRISHLDITPKGVASFGILGPLVFAIVAIIISYILFQSTFFILFFLFAALVLMPAAGKIPHLLANSWRMKASNQMVLCVFYVVTYMRHTSNLELAIEFAADHINPPLSLDLRKVLWDIETETFPTITESLESYLVTWKKWNSEFIESFHLIEASLLESSEDRRLEMLDKSLTVMLDGTYEKMLHYAHNLKSPITMLHMLGVILPILGLVILPLVVSFMPEVQWYHLFALYNLGLPVAVFFLGKNILSKRPTGYGESDISEYNPELKKKRNVNILGIPVNPAFFAVGLAVLLIIIGYIPLIIHAFNPSPEYDFCFGPEGLQSAITLPAGERGLCFLDYRERSYDEQHPEWAGQIIGPYGIGASLFSVIAIIGVGVGLGSYYKLRSKNVIKIRDRSKKLEEEFASALFTLGNRLGDGLPPEIAFGRVAESMKDTMSGNFFNVASNNIVRLGMGVEQAVFDKRYGALKQFPSSIVESSMKVLVESAKKGPKVAAQALVNVSNYIKQIHKVNERLKDLLAETVSSMKSQINFLAPVISGIVIGITSMVTFIIGQLSKRIGRLAGEAELAGAQGGGFLSMFSDGVPTFYFQIIVGLYVVQIIWILTVLVNGISNGNDSLMERFLKGKNLVKSTMMYCFIAFTVILLFNLLANMIMKGSLGS